MENKKNIPASIFNGYINQIKSNTMDNAKIKQLFEEGIFNAQELLNEGVLSSAKYNELYPPPPPLSLEEQKYNYFREIEQGNLTDAEIIDLASDGWFSGKELLEQGLISRNKYDIMFITSGKSISYDEWINVPSLSLGRVDVFIFGIAGSGKSCLLAGLFQYGDMSGRLNPQITNRSGYAYADLLMEAVGEGRVPTATSVDHIQYIACDIKDDKKDIHPLTFIEMSGEHFQDAYGKDLSGLEQKKPKLVEYLFKNPNQKVIFLAIDFQPQATNQRKHFAFMLKFLEENGTMNTVESIVLVITKMDGEGEHLQQQAKQFLQTQYQNLLAICDEYVEKYGINFFIYKFSLGYFKSKYLYEYNPNDSQKIFDLLSQITSRQRNRNNGGEKTPWWKKIIGKK